MQATLSRPQSRDRSQRPSFKGIGRSVKYLTHYKSQALLPYIFLVIATLSQLAVPRAVRNAIDSITSLEANATQGLLIALVSIILFAVLRGFFAFLQAFCGEELAGRGLRSA